MKMVIKESRAGAEVKLTVRRYVFPFKKTFVLSPNKSIKGLKLILIVDCEFTTGPISTHKSPCIGDIVSDTQGDILKIVATINP